MWRVLWLVFVFVFILIEYGFFSYFFRYDFIVFGYLISLLLVEFFSKGRVRRFLVYYYFFLSF